MHNQLTDISYSLNQQTFWLEWINFKGSTTHSLNAKTGLLPLLFILVVYETYLYSEYVRSTSWYKEFNMPRRVYVLNKFLYRKYDMNRALSVYRARSYVFADNFRFKLYILCSN